MRKLQSGKQPTKEKPTTSAHPDAKKNLKKTQKNTLAAAQVDIQVTAAVVATAKPPIFHFLF